MSVKLYEFQEKVLEKLKDNKNVLLGLDMG